LAENQRWRLKECKKNLAQAAKKKTQVYQGHSLARLGPLFAVFLLVSWLAGIARAVQF